MRETIEVHWSPQMTSGFWEGARKVRGFPAQPRMPLPGTGEGRIPQERFAILPTSVVVTGPGLWAPPQRKFGIDLRGRRGGGDYPRSASPHQGGGPGILVPYSTRRGYPCLADSLPVLPRRMLPIGTINRRFFHTPISAEKE